MITVQKLTGFDLLKRAAWATSGREITAPLSKWYDSQHSPIRTQLYWIEMLDIPTFVSVHFVRHKIGVEHFVRSNREDRGGNGQADRLTPVTHCMLINADALISMARKRLCNKASPETRAVMQDIVDGIFAVDAALAQCLVPDCVYRGKCHEFTGCKEYAGYN